MRTLLHRARVATTPPASRWPAMALPPAPASQRCWDPPDTLSAEVQAYLAEAMGDRVAAICAALVRPPCTCCVRVNTHRTTPEALLQQLPSLLDCEGDPALERAAKAAYIHPLLPMALIIPGSGPHLVDYSQTQGREVVVGRKAGEAMVRGATLYAPGVLACTHGLEEGDLVAVSVGRELPTGGYGLTRGTVLDLNLPLDDPRLPGRARLCIGTGRAMLSRSSLVHASGGVAVGMVERAFRMPPIGDAIKGLGMLQHLPSLVAAAVLAPPPGARVLDMCAAPGGKCTALAALMQNQGEVVALDRTAGKVAGVKQLAADLRLDCIHAFQADSTKIVQGSGAAGEETKRKGLNSGMLAKQARVLAFKRSQGQDMSSVGQTAEYSQGFAPESFQYVLLDAPCSALGLRPRLDLASVTVRDLRSAAQRQRAFLDVAVALLQPGGTLVYSTCTINPEENEANVRSLLDRHPCMRLVPQSPRLGGPGLTGSLPRSDGGRQALLTADEAALVQRFDPAGELDTIGFFIAKFVKVVEGS